MGGADAIRHSQVAGAPDRIRQLQPAGQVFDESDDSADPASRPDVDRDLCAQASSSSQAGPAPTVDVAKSAAPMAESVPSPRCCGGSSCRGGSSAEHGALLVRERRTTVMIQRIAPELDLESVRRTLGAFGFAGRYDAVHVPINYGSKVHMRYAFVNFNTPEDAALCISTCTGRPFGSFAGSLACNVAYAHSQGAAFTLSQAAKSEGSSRSCRRRAKQRLKQAGAPD